MKKARKVLAILLAVIILICTLSGCESSEKQAQKIVGVWVIPVEAEESLRRQQLESIGMTYVELSVLEHLSFSYEMFHAFNADGTYRLAIDSDSMHSAMKVFYNEVFDVLYDNLTVLEEAYDISFNGASREEFRQYYAEALDFTDYTEMIDYLVDNCFDYTALGADIAYGTYSVKGKRIIMEDEIGDRSGEVEYSLEGNTLTLYFTDGTEVYTKR